MLISDISFGLLALSPETRMLSKKIGDGTTFPCIFIAVNSFDSPDCSCIVHFEEVVVTFYMLPFSCWFQ